jgi:hypothetical protein
MFKRLNHILPFLLISFLSVSCSNSTINEEISDFSIADTNKIDKIIIKNTQDTIILNKNNQQWRLNNSFKASNKKIKLLLQTISLLQMNTILPENSIEKISDKLKKSTEIKIFQQNKVIKKYYIGDYIVGLGNYAMLENQKPVVVHIPSYDFDLRKNFTLDKKYWQSKILFNLKPEEINSIYLKNYTKNTEFYIFRDKSDKFLLSEDTTIKNYTEPNAENINFYLSHFSNVPFVDFVEIEPDSIEKLPQIFEIFVKINSGNKINFKGYRIENDKDKFIGILDNTSVITCKYYDFDLLIKEYKYFER